jgi:hypothetical protein
MTADCEIDKTVDGEVTTIAELPLSGYELGYPRGPGQGIFHWSKATMDPAMNGDEYCAKFWGDDGPIILFGHYSDGTTHEEEGDEKCGKPEPLQGYYMEACVGSFVWVNSFAQLIPGVHLSYRYETEPLFCYWFGVILDP